MIILYVVEWSRCGVLLSKINSLSLDHSLDRPRPLVERRVLSAQEGPKRQIYCLALDPGEGPTLALGLGAELTQGFGVSAVLPGGTFEDLADPCLGIGGYVDRTADDTQPSRC